MTLSSQKHVFNAYWLSLTDQKKSKMAKIRMLNDNAVFISQETCQSACHKAGHYIAILPLIKPTRQIFSHCTECNKESVSSILFGWSFWICSLNKYFPLYNCPSFIPAINEPLSCHFLFSDSSKEISLYQYDTKSYVKATLSRIVRDDVEAPEVSPRTSRSQSNMSFHQEVQVQCRPK